MKVYITRDEGDCKIWLWLKSKRGNWKPEKLKDCPMVVWQRGDMDDLDSYQCYLATDFKKKFGTTINAKTRKLVDLEKQLIKSSDYRLFSDDPDRKK